MLTQLVQNEIDPNPVLRDRLVSVMLLGTSFQVPVGKDVGGDFANIPLCHSDHDTGCVITYASFRANKPPPPNSLFGASAKPGWTSSCTNPASLRGGAGFLHPYLPADGRSLPILPPTPPVWDTLARRHHHDAVRQPAALHPGTVRRARRVHVSRADGRRGMHRIRESTTSGVTSRPSGVCISSTPTSRWGIWWPSRRARVTRIGRIDTEHHGRGQRRRAVG